MIGNCRGMIYYSAADRPTAISLPNAYLLLWRRLKKILLVIFILNAS